MTQELEGSSQEPEKVPEPLAQGEDWKARFDGLMSGSQKREAQLQSQISGATMQVSQLNSRIASMEAQMAEQVRQGRQAMIDSADPDDRLGLELRAVREEVSEVKQRLQESERQRQNETAIQQAIARQNQYVQHWTSRGVPADVLDTSSPEAMNQSALAWLAEQNRTELEATKRELQDLKKREPQVAAEAEARTREELGATRVVTSGGSPPSVPNQIDALNAQLAAARKNSDFIAAFRIKRELQALGG